ncbi:MAG: SAM-dependent methyltransferase, partial [Lachnospiraceae bacterium]|nr:SAM-dependent methyltransferase [Lachnospiraceae bacterium]
MAKQVQLSKRLKMLADLVTPGNVTAEVGCDHGFLSIYLIQNGISPRVIASDVRQGPLDAAREYIAEWKLENYIETRLS